MSKDLEFFRKSFNDPGDLIEKLEEDKENKVEKYIIPVQNGELRIIVENGVPKITYQMENGYCVVDMLNNNSLRMINVF